RLHSRTPLIRYLPLLNLPLRVFLAQRSAEFGFSAACHFGQSITADRVQTVRTSALPKNEAVVNSRSFARKLAVAIGFRRKHAFVVQHNLKHLLKRQLVGTDLEHSLRPVESTCAQGAAHGYEVPDLSWRRFVPRCRN